jgi:hypothetical protein
LTFACVVQGITPSQEIFMFTSSSRLPTAAAAVFAGALAVAVVEVAAAPLVPPPTASDALHARAVESFRVGRYAEAYGRLVALANAGHGAAARQALWMCLNGPSLFGRDWDCSPQQVEAWAATPDAHAPRPPRYPDVVSGSTASATRVRP